MFHKMHASCLSLLFIYYNDFGRKYICLFVSNLLLRDFKIHLEEVCIERPEFVFQKKEDETLDMLLHREQKGV